MRHSSLLWAAAGVMLSVLLGGCGAQQAVTIDSTGTPMEKSFKIIGYAGDGNIVLSLIQFDKLTHINYAFLLPKADGTFFPLLNPSKLEQIVEKAHEKGVKVLISVGGWGYDGEFEILAVDAESRERFIENLLNLVEEYQLDGVDIDWEYPGPGMESAQNYLELMRGLSVPLHSQGKLLTAAVAAAGENGDGILKEVFDLVDFLNLMVYDGPGTNHASYDYALEALDYWNGRGLSPEKMTLGVPFYSRPGEVPYRKLVKYDPAAAMVDEFSYYGSMEYYNGIPTIQRKTDLAKRRASGIMIWELSLDTNDANSLLNAIFQAAYPAQ
jgi:chitinase